MVSSLNAFFLSSCFSTYCFTETWLSDFILDNEIIPPGYSTYRKDRSTRGGGVLVAVKDSIPSVRITAPDDLEVVAVRLGGNHSIILCTVYVSPSAQGDYHSSLLDFLSFLCTSLEPVVIVGDFNCPDICWSTLTASSDMSCLLCDLVFRYNLTQLVDYPTHNKGNILDLVFVKGELVEDIVIGEQNLRSDHYSISFKMRAHNDQGGSSKSRIVFDYSKADWDGLCCFLMDSDFSCCYDTDDIDQIWCTFKQIVNSSMDLFIPKVRLKAHQYPQWFTQELRHQSNHLKSLRVRCQTKKSAAAQAKLEREEQHLVTAVKTAKSNYERDLINKMAKNDSSHLLQVHWIPQERWGDSTNCFFQFFLCFK